MVSGRGTSIARPPRPPPPPPGRITRFESAPITGFGVADALKPPRPALFDGEAIITPPRRVVIGIIVARATTTESSGPCVEADGTTLTGGIVLMESRAEVRGRGRVFVDVDVFRVTAPANGVDVGCEKVAV